MKLTTIKVNGKCRVAKVLEDKIHVIRTDATLNEIIEKGDVKQLDALPSEEVSEFEWANLLQPDKIICVGYNYPKHSKGMKVDLPTTPVLFSKFRDAIAKCGDEIPMVSYEDTYDYEGELVIVIGKEGYQIPKEEVFDHIFGYTVGNDVSIRGAQFRTSQYLIGKAMPKSGPIGPYLVSADEFDPKNKRIETRVNGELRQSGNTDEMIFKIEDIVSFASAYFPLHPGDLIFTGTPSGVARELPEKGYLKDGDCVSITIEGIGTLTNTMRQY